MLCFDHLDVPAPTQMGPGLYPLWIEACRKDSLLAPITGIERARRIVVDVRLADYEHPSLQLLAWVDRLLRDSGVMPTASRVQEYGIAVQPESVNKGRISIKVFWEPTSAATARPRAQNDVEDDLETATAEV